MTSKQRFSSAWPCGIALVCLLLAAPSLPRDPSAPEIEACVLASRPQVNTLETVRLISTDRSGRGRVRRASVYVGRTADGYRALYMQMLSPSELVGSSLLVARRDDKLEAFLALASDDRMRRIEGTNSSGGLFGTDFSFEDLGRLYGMNRLGDATRLGDGEIDGRPTFVVRTRPAAADGSSYDSIVSHVDQESCITLRSELYEQAGITRKVLTVATDSIERVGDGWIARSIQIRDLRDESETRLEVQTVFFGVDVLDLPFGLD